MRIQNEDECISVIQGVPRRNKNGGTDIVIFDPPQLNRRVESAVLDTGGAPYNVYIGGICVSRNVQSGHKMFPTPVMPLDLLRVHQLLIVVPDVMDEEQVYTLRVKYASNVLLHREFGRALNETLVIPWGEDNSMRFTAGMCCPLKWEPPANYANVDGQVIAYQSDEYDQNEPLAALHHSKGDTVIVQCATDIDTCIYDRPDAIVVISEAGALIDGHVVQQGQIYNCGYARFDLKKEYHTISNCTYNKVYINGNMRISFAMTPSYTVNNLNDVEIKPEHVIIKVPEHAIIIP